jgi:lauroyl/myristoyl acyltransferase
MAVITLFYKALVDASKRWGMWIFYMASWMIATGYFFLFPVRVRTSVRFYRALFPNQSAAYHIYCAWRQFHRFTHVYIDRCLLHDSNSLSFNMEGWHHLENIISQKTGGILLMSHIGNWEIAAQVLQEKSIPLMLFMGKKNKEQIEGAQKEHLKKSGVQIITSDHGEYSPVDILEAVRFLKQGGIVSMTGDRVWSLNQKTVKTVFLNHEITIPEAPHAIAMLTGVPLLVFFSFCTGRQKYHVVLNPPFFLKPDSRRDREKSIQRSAGNYARLLEAAVTRHPDQWYHFEPFLGPRIR